MMNWSGGHWGMEWGSLLATLLIILIYFSMAVVVVWIARALLSVRRGTERSGPLDLLKRRFAAGEITHAEYEQARHAIE